MWLLIFGTLLVAWLVHLYVKQQRARVNLPGPLCLPIVGNLRMSSSLHLTFDEWSEKHGSLFYVSMMGMPFVVISDQKIAKELYSLDAFTGRVNLDMFNLYEGEKRGLINSEGNLWEVHRRFSLRQLRDFGFGKNTMETLIMDEVHEMIEMLTKKGGKPVGEIKEKFSLGVVNSLWTIVGGKRFSQDDPELLALTRKLADVLKVATDTGGLIIMLPWLRHIMPDFMGYTGIRAAFENLKKFVASAVEDHVQTYQSDTTRDFMDAYLKERHESKDTESTFKGPEGIKQLTAIVADLFFAGTDTTSTTLSWIVLYLAAHPELQKKLQNEISAITGDSRDVSVADRPNMPYANAILEETLRKSSIVPLGEPHKTIQEVTHKGITYPKGTHVGFNIYHIHHSKKIWGDPENFRPERFLSADEKTFKKSENVVAFSIGKRQCLGETLARDSLFLFMTNLFQKFKVSCDPDKPKPTLEPMSAFAMSPREYSVTFTNRGEE